MNIETKLSKIIENTISDIKNNKYRLIEIGQFDSKIQYKDNVLEVWVANEEYGCKISSRIKGLEFPELDDETRKMLYKLATTKTPHLIKVKLKEARRAHRELYLKYKESVMQIELLKAELRNFDNL